MSKLTASVLLWRAPSCSFSFPFHYLSLKTETVINQNYKDSQVKALLIAAAISSWLSWVAALTCLLSNAKNWGGVSKGKMLFVWLSKRDLGLYNFPLFSSAAASSEKETFFFSFNLTYHALTQLTEMRYLLKHSRDHHGQRPWLCPRLLQKQQETPHKSQPLLAHPPAKKRQCQLQRIFQL